MKNISIKFILINLILILFISCQKFLDITPKGFTIPQYYADYEKIMNYVQLGKAASSYPNILTDDVQYTSGDSLLNFNGISESNRRMYSFQYGAIFNDNEADQIWEGAYGRIYTFNVVINNIMNVTDASDTKKRMLKAEAHFARAFEYLTLISAYAKTYDPQTANTDLGVPIIDKEDVGDRSYIRNTVAEVYEKIQLDMNEALPFLAQNTSNSFRPSKNAGYAFYARMYLYKGEYEKALENAKIALDLKKILVDLKLYGAAPNILFDRIRKLPQLTEPYPEGIKNDENIYVRYLTNVAGLNTSIFASGNLLNVYKKDLATGEIDKRRELWYSDNKFRTSNFPGRTMWVQYVRANLGLNTMDVLLTAAECYARIGGSQNILEAQKL